MERQMKTEEKPKRKVLFFTGAGVSEESGIPTFRDRLGLWNISDPNEVASKNAWRENRERVLDFHNRLRKMVLESVPNTAHEQIAEMEKHFEVSIVTQNVDDLHERAGSTFVIHLHGSIMEARSTLNPSLVFPWRRDILIGNKCMRGSQLRPNVVWFGEELNEDLVEDCISKIRECDVLVVVGTSLSVYPANSLLDYLDSHKKLILLDPNAESIDVDKKFNVTRISKKAMDGISDVRKLLGEAHH